jgi:beta-phosphoglucomutase-like phosphatase (HAD superfamily)
LAVPAKCVASEYRPAAGVAGRGIARYFASRFVAHRQGWKQFCSEMNIDPEVQLDFMIGWGTILRTDKAARELAFSAEEACQFVRLETMPAEGNESLERGPVPVETIEELVEGWLRFWSIW